MPQPRPPERRPDPHQLLEGARGRQLGRGHRAGRPRREPALPPGEPPEGTPCVLRFSRNGLLLLAGGGTPVKSGRVVAWEVRTGKRVLEVGDEMDTVLAADLSPDGSLVALGGPAKVVRVYSTRGGGGP